MKILKIGLENVKSYQQEEIHFHEGINVIAGRNGAGKSTLIEAIGFGLFGYKNNDYTLDDFVSRGANNGKIAIDFDVQGERYRIERYFNTSTTRSWSIHDYQTDETIDTHTHEDVQYFLANLLGVHGDMKLQELFERIIGVNQGTFTEPFLRAPGGRKDYFERIFMLDSYKNAYNKSSDASNLLRNQIEGLEKELIRFQTRVEDYSKVKEKAADTLAKLQEVKEDLEKKRVVYAELKEKIESQKNLDKELQECKKRDLQLNEQNRQIQERLIEVADQIKEGQQAKELVEKYQKSRDQYLETKEIIAQLVEKEEKEAELIEKKQDLKTEIALMTQDIKSQKEQIKHKREELLNEYKQREDELEEYSLPIASVKKELNSVLDQQKKEEELMDQLAELTSKHQQAQEGLRKLEDRLLEMEDNQNEIENLKMELIQIPELTKAVLQMTEWEKEVEKLNQQITRLATQISAEEEKCVQLKDGLCPLLHTECKNLEGQDLKEYFMERVQTLEKEKEALVEKRTQLQEKLAKEAPKKEKLTLLKGRKTDLTKKQERQEEIRLRSEALAQEIYQILQTFFSGLEKIKVGGYLPDSGSLEFTAVLPLKLTQQKRWLTTQIDIGTNYLILGQTQLKNSHKENVQKMSELNQVKTELTSKMEQTNERRKEINDQLAKLTDQEKELQKSSQILTDKEEEMVELEKSLESFGDVKGELKKAREKLTNLEEGNQIYLTNQQKASELVQSQKLEQELVEKGEEIVSQLMELKGRLEELEAQFDSKELKSLEESAEELNRQVSQAETLYAEREKGLKELTRQLTEMEKIQEQIKEYKMKQDKLKKGYDLLRFIRNLYNSAAEDIAQLFLRYISHEATRYYRELSGENVQLIWQKDYQVQLKDKHRTRVFRQLSGGEQMSAAFAIRLALLRKFSSVRLGFFDEPTTHLDEMRRLNIAQAIAEIREQDDQSFEQIFIISHDDTFTTLTENLIKVEKNEERGSYLIRD